MRSPGRHRARLLGAVSEESEHVVQKQLKDLWDEAAVVPPLPLHTTATRDSLRCNEEELAVAILCQGGAQCGGGWA